MILTNKGVFCLPLAYPSQRGEYCGYYSRVRHRYSSSYKISYSLVSFYFPNAAHALQLFLQPKFHLHGTRRLFGGAPHLLQPWPSWAKAQLIWPRRSLSGRRSQGEPRASRWEGVGFNASQTRALGPCNPRVSQEGDLGLDSLPGFQK